MSFSENALLWDKLAQEDPLWAILTDPRHKAGKWNYVEFMATGERQVATVLDRVCRFAKLDSNGTALDFGCGVGRLSYALAKHFRAVVGSDISAHMIGQACAHAPANCRFVRNDKAPLDFPNGHFSFIYSDIVLQHIPEPYSMHYIADFVRLLAPGGIAVFQVQTGIAGLSALQRTKRRLRIRERLGLMPPQRQMGMWTLPRLKVLKSIGPARVLDEVFTGAKGADYNGEINYSAIAPESGYLSVQFTIQW